MRYRLHHVSSVSDVPAAATPIPMTELHVAPTEPTRRDAAAPLPIGTARAARELGRVTDLDGATSRFGARSVSTVVEGLLAYDVPAQAAAADFARGDGGQSMLRWALDHGIDEVDDPPDTLRALFAEVDRVPDWVDWEQLRRGAVAYWRPGPLVSFVFTTAAVVGGDSGYGVTRPQSMTGRFEKRAYTRSAETFRWLMAATTPGGMRRGEDGFKLSVRVRMLHAAVRAGCAKSPAWQWDEWGVPINLTDQLYALNYSFTTVMFDAFARLGVRYSRAEIDDMWALWRYIGYVIGIPEPALPRGDAEARHFRAVWQALDPGADDVSRAMIHALITLATPEVPDPAQRMDVFPELAMKLLPPLRMRAFMYGLSRHLLGDATCDAVEIPDDRWKHAGRAIRPAMTLVEVGRRLGLLDDERIGRQSVGLFERALGARPGEAVIAPADEVLAEAIALQA